MLIHTLHGRINVAQIFLLRAITDDARGQYRRKSLYRDFREVAFYATFRTVAKGDGDRSEVSGVLLWLLPCLVAFLTVGCSGSEPSQEEAEEAQSPTDGPNIIFILTDDLDFASAQKMPETRS